MPELFGKNYTKREFLQYSGNPSNFAGITGMEYAEGKARGARALLVKTGAGLEFTLLPDKCLDIFTLSYRGVTLSQQSKNGLTNPLRGLPVPGMFPETVSGGMLFTSGLLNSGPESVEDDGKFHQAHGNIGVTPAENLCARSFWDGDEYRIEASGTMRESALFGHNLVLTRHISTKLGSKELTICDTVENQESSTEEVALLYHFNFGFPFLSPELALIFPENKCTPRTPEAADGLAAADKIIAPEKNFFEHVFFRDLAPDENGWCTVRAENKNLGIGAYISYEKELLPNLCQWKSMRAGDYALGIEPCNNFIMGRRAERVNGSLPRLSKFETAVFRLKLGVYDL